MQMSLGLKMRLIPALLVLGLVLSGCDRTSSSSEPVTIAGRPVEGMTPDNSFLGTCTRSYQGIQLIETGSSVRRLVEAFRLAPTAVMSWERVSPMTYILRLTNNDPLTRQSGEVSLQLDRNADVTATPTCGVGVTDISRMTVNGVEIQPPEHLNALMALVDFERLASEFLQQNPIGSPPKSEVQSAPEPQNARTTSQASGTFTVREPIEGYWNDWDFRRTSTWVGDPVELAVTVEGKTRGYDGTATLICSRNGVVNVDLQDTSGQPVESSEIPGDILDQVTQHYC